MKIVISILITTLLVLFLTCLNTNLQEYIIRGLGLLLSVLGLFGVVWLLLDVHGIK